MCASHASSFARRHQHVGAVPATSPASLLLLASSGCMPDHVLTMLLPGPCAGVGMLLVHQRTLQYVRVLRRVSTQAIADSITPRGTAAQSTDACDAAMQARIPCTSRPATGNVESTQADFRPVRQRETRQFRFARLIQTSCIHAVATSMLTARVQCRYLRRGTALQKSVRYCPSLGCN